MKNYNYSVRIANINEKQISRLYKILGIRLNNLVIVLKSVYFKIQKNFINYYSSSSGFMLVYTF